MYLLRRDRLVSTAKLIGTIAVVSLSSAGLVSAQNAPTETAPIQESSRSVDVEALEEQALSYFYAAQYELAEPLFRELITLQVAELGRLHPTVEASLIKLAELYFLTGQYEEAEPLLVEALAIGRETLGDSHPSVATLLLNLAALYSDTDRGTEAVPMFVQTVDIRVAALPAGHPDIRAGARNAAIAMRAHAPDHPRLAEMEVLAGE